MLGMVVHACKARLGYRMRSCQKWLLKYTILWKSYLSRFKTGLNFFKLLEKNFTVCFNHVFPSPIKYLLHLLTVCMHVSRYNVRDRTGLVLRLATIPTESSHWPTYRLFKTSSDMVSNLE